MNSTIKEKLMWIVGGIVAFLAFSVYLALTGVYTINNATAKHIVETKGLNMSALIAGLNDTEGSDAIASARWLVSQNDGKMPWIYLAALYAAKGGDENLATKYYFLASLTARNDAERCGLLDAESSVVKFEISSGASKVLSDMMTNSPKKFTYYVKTGVEQAVIDEERTHRTRDVASWICPAQSPVLDDAKWNARRDETRKAFISHWGKILKAANEGSSIAEGLR